MQRGEGTGYGVSGLREALQPLLQVWPLYPKITVRNMTLSLQEEMQRMHATIARALEQQVRLLYLLPSSSWNLGIFLLPLLLLLLLLPLVLLLLNFFNQEAAISSMLSLSLPPQPPLPHRVAASPLYPSPPQPHLRASALMGAEHGGVGWGSSSMGPGQDEEEEEEDGAQLASAAPTPAILSHSPGTAIRAFTTCPCIDAFVQLSGPDHRSSRRTHVDLSAVASPQPLFPSRTEAASHSLHHSVAGRGVSGGHGDRESFMDHNRLLLSHTLQVIAHL